MRADFAQRLQGIIDAYNAGSSSADNYFEELVKFTKDLKAESERHIREGLTEDELELFDLLKKDKMTKEETQKVKLAAKSLCIACRKKGRKSWFRTGSKIHRAGAASKIQSRAFCTPICPKVTTALCSQRNATTCLT